MNSLEEKKKQWSEIDLCANGLFGVRTTQRSEAINNTLKNWLRGKQSLEVVIKILIDMMGDYAGQRGIDSTTVIQARPQPSETKQWKVYHKSMVRPYKKMLQQFAKLSNIVILENDLDTNALTLNINGERVTNRVTATSCDWCNFHAEFQLPCCHMIAVLSVDQLVETIGQRWWRSSWKK